MFPLQPLTQEKLPAVKALAAQLFPWEDEHQDALSAAVGGTDSARFLSTRGLARVRAWHVDERDEVAGLCSLYEYHHSPEEVWLAWFGLSAEVRGRGWGSKLLDEVISLSRREEKSVLRLWTTIEDEYATALQLYARRGFRPELQPALPGEDWQTVVLSLSLRGGVPPPWRGHLTGIGLCGRMVPAAA